MCSRANTVDGVFSANIFLSTSASISLLKYDIQIIFWPRSSSMKLSWRSSCAFLDQQQHELKPTMPDDEGRIQKFNPNPSLYSAQVYYKTSQKLRILSRSRGAWLMKPRPSHELFRLWALVMSWSYFFFWQKSKWI